MPNVVQFRYDVYVVTNKERGGVSVLQLKPAESVNIVCTTEENIQPVVLNEQKALFTSYVK